MDKSEKKAMWEAVRLLNKNHKFAGCANLNTAGSFFELEFDNWHEVLEVVKMNKIVTGSVAQLKKKYLVPTVNGVASEAYRIISAAQFFESVNEWLTDDSETATLQAIFDESGGVFLVDTLPNEEEEKVVLGERGSAVEFFSFVMMMDYIKSNVSNYNRLTINVIRLDYTAGSR